MNEDRFTNAVALLMEKLVEFLSHNEEPDLQDTHVIAAAMSQILVSTLAHVVTEKTDLDEMERQVSQLALAVFDHILTCEHHPAEIKAKVRAHCESSRKLTPEQREIAELEALLQLQSPKLAS